MRETVFTHDCISSRIHTLWMKRRLGQKLFSLYAFRHGGGASKGACPHTVTLMQRPSSCCRVDFWTIFFQPVIIGRSINCWWIRRSNIQPIVGVVCRFDYQTSIAFVFEFAALDTIDRLCYRGLFGCRVRRQSIIDASVEFCLTLFRYCDVGQLNESNVGLSRWLAVFAGCWPVLCGIFARIKNKAMPRKLIAWFQPARGKLSTTNEYVNWHSVSWLSGYDAWAYSAAAFVF